MSTNHSLRTAPGTMIANVPGILGFYPHEAAVVMTVCADGDDGYVMGPVIRGDLNQIDGLADVIASLEPAAPIELAVAVIVTDDIDSPAARAAQEELFCAADTQGRALLHACWHVPEIVTDATYTLLFGPHSDEPGWRTGRVGNVATSEAMTPHLASGILPVADQHVIDEYFALRPVANGAALAEQADLIHQGVQRIADANRRADDGDTGALVLMLRTIETALALAPERAIVDVDHDDAPRLADLVADAEARSALYGALTSARARDALIATVLDAPASAAGVLLAVARETNHPLIRANALSLWAMIAVDQGSSTWAQAAARAALATAPRHNLANMIRTILRQGDGGKLVPLARRGCEDTWAGLDAA